MSVKIRMKRTGSKNKPCYRIVVADARAQRDGRIIENLGFYDPRHKNEKIDLERADYWISCGAQPTETAAGVITRAKNGTPKKPVAIKAVEAKSEEAPAAKVEETKEEKTEA